ncbi:hypothetical protein REPUB_Repub11eG0049200 [Reevesia pubescens]
MLLEGLCDIHEKVYFHCDLKPANILVFSSDIKYASLSTLKIADFGLAKEPGERDSVPMTTTPWLNFRGCIVVEMMTGKPPWNSIRNSKFLALQIASTSKSPNIPEDISMEGKDFSMKCFARDPCKRWTAHRLLTHPFLFHDSTLLAPQRSFLQDALVEIFSL